MRQRLETKLIKLVYFYDGTTPSSGHCAATFFSLPPCVIFISLVKLSTPVSNPWIAAANSLQPKSFIFSFSREMTFPLPVVVVAPCRNPPARSSEAVAAAAAAQEHINKTSTRDYHNSSDAQRNCREMISCRAGCCCSRCQSR